MTIWYVDGVNGQDSAAGTEGAPLKSINAAMNKAGAGDEIVAGDGVYHEALNVTKRLTIRAANPLGAAIDGRYGPKLRGDKSFVGQDGKPVAAGALPSPVAANINKGGWKAVGSGGYAPLVKVTAADAVIEGFVIRNSHGRGLALMGDRTVARNCHMDFCYAGGLWISGETSSKKVKDVTVEGCVVTRGSLRAFDPTRGYGGTPMGVDVCCLTRFSIGTKFVNCIVAYNLGEGIASGKGAEETTIKGCISHTNLHANIYINGGGKKTTVVDCRAYDCLNAVAQLEASGLNMFNNVVLGDEEPDFQSGPGLVLRRCVFVGGAGDRPFEIGGWGGGGNFPRPFVLDGAFVGDLTIVGGPKSVAVALFGSSTHKGHKGSLVQNLILLKHPEMDGGLQAHSHGAGWKNVVARNCLSNVAFPAALGAKDSLVTGEPILVNPFAPIEAVGFELFGEARPDALATTFDIDHYRPMPGSPALGMAANGPANGITPPETKSYVGALDMIDEPVEPDPEPEPPPPDPEPEPEPPPPDPEPEPEPPPPDPEPEPEPKPDWREGLDPRDRDLLVSAANYAIGPRGGFPGEGLILLVDKLAGMLDEK